MTSSSIIEVYDLATITSREGKNIEIFVTSFEDELKTGLTSLLSHLFTLRSDDATTTTTILMRRNEMPKTKMNVLFHLLLFALFRMDIKLKMGTKSIVR